MAQVWDGMLSHLDLRRSFRVVLWDLMGAFSTPSTSYDFQRYASLCLHANDLLKVLDALGEAGGEGQGEGQGKVGPVKGWQGVEVENVVCVGHSVSGMVALLASLKCPSAFSPSVAPTMVEPRRPARAALPNPICPGARASAAAGGGAARSAGGAAA
ncbi:unnamed protein product [Closterium sp. NIES-64]|nr:unnamed protein product [Closterium sp. NIES-64]